MTVSELEQAMRNLISTQPMITVGPNGDVVSSLLAIIDIYKNFSFKVQIYPAQDAFKFGMMSELQKLESDMCNYICQTMSSRGINLLLYTPQAQYNSNGNAFSTVAGPINQNMAMGQMMYQTQSPNMQFAQAQPTYQAPINMPNIAPQFSGNSGMGQAVQGAQMNNHVYQQPVIGGGVLNPKQSQNRNSFEQRRPIQQNQMSNRPANHSVSGQGVGTGMVNKNSSAGNGNVQKPVPNSNASASSKPNPAEMLMGGADAPTGKAPGRDYLLELLKK